MNKSLRAVVDRSTAYKPKVIKVEPVIGHHRGSDLESPAPPGKDASNNIISSHSPDKPRLASNKVYPEPTGGGGAGESASVTVSTSVTNLLSYNNETKMGAELDTNTDTGIQPPVWQPVLQPLTFLIDPALCPHYATSSLSFSIMFVSLTLLPIYLSRAPYNLNSTLNGICFLPIGVTMLVAAVSGGICSDYSASKYKQFRAGRLVLPLLLSVAIYAGTLGAFSAQNRN